MKVFVFAIAWQILLNVYIVWRGSRAIPARIGRRILYITVGTEFALYLFGFCFRTLLPKPIMEFILTVCNTWYIGMVYAAMGTALINLVRHICRRAGYDPEQKISAERYKRLKVALFGLVTAAAVCFVGWGYRVERDTVITHERIILDKPLGAERKTLRIAFMADLHFSETITRTYAERMVRLCNEQHPDIVLIGGDIFDYWSYYGYRDGIPALMRNIRAPLGVYYVMGNHEYRADVERKKAWVAEVGGKLLIDDFACPGGVFALIGRDDATRKERASLQSLVDKLPDSARCLPRILLEHQPLKLDSLPVTGIDLALYGHTHNGQIFPFTILTRIAFEKSAGYMRKGNSQLFVTSGIGAAGPAIRLFTQSELVVIDLIGK